MKQEHARAICEMAGFIVTDMVKLPNEYYPHMPPDQPGIVKWCQENPWWLIEVSDPVCRKRLGLLRMGPRKRVFSVHFDRMNGLLRPKPAALSVDDIAAIRLSSYQTISDEGKKALLASRITGLDVSVTYDEQGRYFHAWGFLKLHEYLHRILEQHERRRHERIMECRSLYQSGRDWDLTEAEELFVGPYIRS
jgi:hypothetical protein